MADAPSDLESMDLPQGFHPAREAVCEAIRTCERRGIPKETIVAALMTELMPRLVEAYGARGVASALGRLADEIAAAGRSAETQPAETRQ